MGGGQAGAIGGMWNDIINMAQSAANHAEASKDAGDVNRAYEELFKYLQRNELKPEDLMIVAEQMGLPPEVASSLIRNDQINALRQMQNIAARGGMDDAAIAANQQAQIAAARQAQGQDAAIQSQLARQGINPGAGSAIAMRQSAGQNAANQLSMAGTQNAADAQIRALQAVAESGRISGDIASSQEAIAEANRQARFERDRYNTGIRQAVNQYNSGAKLGARQENVSNLSELNRQAQGKTKARAGTRAENKENMQDIGNRGQNVISSFGNMFGGM